MADTGWLDVVDRRAGILAAARPTPLGPRELAETVDLSRSTLNRALRELEEAGLAARVKGGYRTTLSGRLALDVYDRCVGRLAALERAAPVLSALPPEAAVEPAALLSAEVVACDRSSGSPAGRLHDTVADAEGYAAAVPALDQPRHLGLLHEHVVTEERPATLLVPAALFDRLVEEFPRRLGAMAATDRFALLVGEVDPFGLVHTAHDDRERLTLLSYDAGVQGLVENDRRAALAWGRSRLATLAATATDRTPALR